MMRLKFLALVGLLLIAVGQGANPKDDFSEFDAPEDFDSHPPAPSEKPRPADAQQQQHHQSAKPQKDEMIFEEDEFTTLEEEEEEIGLPIVDEGEEAVTTEKTGDAAGKAEPKIKPLTFADIPSHFRSNWSSYQVESLMLAAIFIYALNFIYGKTRNHSIAMNWYAYTRPVLEQQFALVGDDGTSQEPTGGHLIKETEYNYLLWSSGRVGCAGMLSQLKLLKRQDLLGVVINRFVTPRSDRVIHRVDLDVGEMDTFVIAFGVRKTLARIAKEYTDLSSFTAEKKNAIQYGLPASFAVFAEVSECVPSIIDQTTCQFFKRYERFIDYFHFSDQYSGQKAPEEALTKLPETTPTLTFSFNLIPAEQTEEIEQHLLTFMFHTIDRIRRYRLSREGKQKADKNRRAFEESFLKNTHQQRQEAAQARREEKTRERKAKILEEEDPQKQLKLQKMEAKKENKLKQPKVKQLRVK